MNACHQTPLPTNEPVLDYCPGSPERIALTKALQRMKNNTTEIPMFVGEEEIFEGNRIAIHPPHEHEHVLGHFYEGDKITLQNAVKAAAHAKPAWANMPWEARASIFLKAAELLSGPYRQEINAATMLCQSKNAYQAEIDSACELIDFFRYNAAYMQAIYEEQPSSSKGVWNRLEYRPLEGFIFAITPFNFTSIAGNLPTAPALMGNTVIWKPAYAQIYSAAVIMRVLKEAGLPDGVINLIYVRGPICGDVLLPHPDFAGLHFTGSTRIFQSLWKTIGSHLPNYRNYPRIVGETGGKDFIIAHPSADVDALSVAILRGGYEYQGQKCSAASRVYIPSNLWSTLKQKLFEGIESMKVGPVENFSNFINAVITQAAYTKITTAIDAAKQNPQIEVFGGHYASEEGYFIHPTLLITQDPHVASMQEEIFGPVVSLYVYPEKDYEATLDLLNQTSPYGLTGAVFSQDRYAIQRALTKLTYAAGNFYINDKPTGAVVGQQPFGGGRLSGTNDKAGAALNLLRWVSPRTIKETFVPSKAYPYPFMQKEQP